MEEDPKNVSSSRGKGRGRGRGRKKNAESGSKVHESTTSSDVHPLEPESLSIDLDADITQLEAPTFSTINKGPPEPMLRLNWDHKTHLIGEKVVNPMIHCCDKCEAPILIYGRMIPCKHVFCVTCAEKENKVCPRCQEKVVRVERTGLGTVFMCTFGGTRYGNTGCRRTYLSQRDLQAHINHRHVSCSTTVNKDGISNSQASSNTKTLLTTTCRPKSSVNFVAVSGDPRVHNSNSSEYIYKMHQSPSSHTSSSSQQSKQSIHPNNISHQADQQQNVQISNLSHQPFPSLTSSGTQRHLPISSTQQLLPSSNDFVNQMMMSNYLQTNPVNLSCSPNISNNLVPMTMHDSSLESNNSALNLSRATNFHQNFSPQFSQTSSPGIPFPVPPPGQPALSPVPQSQYFTQNLMTTYPTPPQRTNVSHFSPNSPAQNMINQPQIMSTNTPNSRRTQFSSETVIPSFPVPPTHRWPQQSNQTHYY